MVLTGKKLRGGSYSKMDTLYVAKKKGIYQKSIYSRTDTVLRFVSSR